jgi:streptogramin lyase
MNRTTIARILVLVLVFAASAVTGRAADPELSKIGPATIAVADPDFTLRVSGENFDRNSTVLLDGVAVPTTFVSKRRLYARIPVTASAAAGSHSIAVRSSSGFTTAPKTLTVVAKAAGITAIRINSDSIGVVTTTINVEFRISGSGFNSNSQVLVFGNSLDTTVREKGVLSVIVPSTYLSDAAILPFQVKEGGQFSNMVTVPVYGRVPAIDTLDPGVVKTSAESVSVKINGNGFDTDATVIVNDVELTPTEIMSQQIKVVVPASLLGDEAQLAVYVRESTGLSNAAILRVTPTSAPYAYSLSPVAIQAGAPATQVAVIGANFKDNAELFVNGQKVNSNVVSGGRMTFKLTKTQLASPATYTITVKNPDGMTTNAVAIDVVAAAMVSTLAGKKLDGFDDGTVDTATFRYPSRVAIGPDGLLYVADQANHAVRRVDPSSGFVETLAGDGKPGYVDSGDSSQDNFDAPRFNNPLGIAVRTDGTVFVADYGNNVIRRLRPNGSAFTVDTVAGANERIDDKATRDQTNSTRRGLQGFHDAPGAEARFRGVDGMSLASDGKLFVADAQNFYIRVVDTASAGFDVSTIAGLGISGFVDGDRETARFSFPVDVALTPDEASLIVADLNNRRVRRIDLATGAVGTVAGNGSPGTTSGSALFATFTNPIGVTVAPDGTIFVADNQSNTIRRVETNGVTTTLAGGGDKTKFRDGIGPEANFKAPRGLVYDASLDSLFVVDQGHSRVRRIEP